jgi:hypothetical protein
LIVGLESTGKKGLLMTMSYRLRQMSGCIAGSSLLVLIYFLKPGAVLQNMEHSPTSSISPHHPLRAKRPASSLSPLEQQLANGLWRARQSPEEADRLERIQEVAVDMTNADLPPALCYLVTKKATALELDLALRLLERWSQLDPHAARDWVAGLPENPFRRQAANQVMVALAAENVNEALEWISQWTDETDRREGRITLSYEASRKDPVGALGIALAEPADKERDEAVAVIGSRWAQRAPEAAAAWAKQIPDVALREKSISMIAFSWGYTNPSAAAALALGELPPGENQDRALIGIFEAYAKQDPQAARKWAEQFPEGALKKSALEHLALITGGS